MTKISAENQAQLDALNTLRTAYKTLEVTEKQRIAALVREKLANERQAIETLMAKLRQDGVPVRQIGAAFGSSSYATVVQWIEAGETLLALGTPVEIVTTQDEDTPTVEKVERTASGFPGWKIMWPDEVVAEVYTNDDGDLKAVGAGRKRWDENPHLTWLEDLVAPKRDR